MQRFVLALALVLTPGCVSAEAEGKVKIMQAGSHKALELAQNGVELQDGSRRPCTREELVGLLQVQTYGWDAVAYYLGLSEQRPEDPVIVGVAGVDSGQ